MSFSGRVWATSSSMRSTLRLTRFSNSLAHIRSATVDPIASCWRASRTVSTTVSMTPVSLWWPAYMRFVTRSIIGVGRVANKRFSARQPMSVRSPSSARTLRPSWSRSMPPSGRSFSRSTVVALLCSWTSRYTRVCSMRSHSFERCAPGSRRCSRAMLSLTTRSKRACARGSPSEDRLDTSGGVDAR